MRAQYALPALDHQWTRYDDPHAQFLEVLRGVGGAGTSGANVAIGNFASNGKIPLDLYNIDAVEINRGPNSNLFGIGNSGYDLEPASFLVGNPKDDKRRAIAARAFGGSRRFGDGRA